MEIAYNKTDILKSKKFARKRDVLSVVLKDDAEYTIEEVNELYNEFMRKEVE